jgi:N-acetylglutamate synthase-like GNAT family acetyltransferase
MHAWGPPAGETHSLVVVARSRGRVVGFSWASGDSDPTAQILEVAVLREHQGRGVGPRLVKESAHWMRDLGYEEIYILPISESATWVTSHGFVPVAHDGYSARISDIR